MKHNWNFGKFVHVVIYTLIFVCVSVSSTPAATTWTGAGDGQDWFDAANWDSGVPGAGSDAVINSGAVLLTNSTDALHSLTMGGGMLTFSNWNTQLSALNVTIQSGATLTHVTNSATTTNGLGEWAPDGRVWIVCTNFDLRSGGKIDAKGRGFMGRDGTEGLRGYGPGGGESSSYYGGGGGHGGRGGNGSQGLGGGIYGLTNAPEMPGSGGGGNRGGDGGGAVRVAAGVGSVTVSGEINADATDGVTWGPGGSGGSIYITCGTFEGMGLVTAKGGRAGSVGSAGAGAGGRIAIVYEIDAQSVLSVPGVRFNVASGDFPAARQGDSGTFYVPDTALFRSDLMTFEDVRLYGPTNWSVDSMGVTNCRVAFADIVSLVVTGDVVLDGCALSLGDTLTPPFVKNLYCGSLLLTNGATLSVCAGPTNAPPPDRGALVSVNGDIVIATNSWIHPISDGTNGGSVLFKAVNVWINAGGGFDAAGLGYDGGGLGIDGFGPGGGRIGGSTSYGGGGGFGGKGGTGRYGGVGGGVYLSTNAPASPGSGGAGNGGGAGGGLVWIEAGRTIVIEGSVNADGNNGSTWGSGGSGGGILLCARSFAGDGELTAVGGDRGNVGYSGGGGGGRIAIWHRVAEPARQAIFADPDNAQNNVPRFFSTNNLSLNGFSGTWSVNYGAGYSSDAEPGTAVYITAPPPEGTVFSAE